MSGGLSIVGIFKEGDWLDTGIKNSAGPNVKHAGSLVQSDIYSDGRKYCTF